MTVDDLGPYSRVYWRIRADERFVGIYTDNHHLATWLRLLIAADAVWPAPADLPRSARQASVTALESAGLIELLPGDLFRVHGLDAERERRASAGKAGAAARWKRPESDRNAVALPPQSVTNASRAKPRRDETSNARALDGLPHLNSTVAAIWEEATGRTVLASGAKVAEQLDDACRRHPPSEVGAAILRARRTFDHIPEVNALASALRRLLDPFPDGKATDAARREAEAQAASRRRSEDTLRRTHDLGAHENAPRPNCPSCKGEAA